MLFQSPKEAGFNPAPAIDLYSTFRAVLLPGLLRQKVALLPFSSQRRGFSYFSLGLKLYFQKKEVLTLGVCLHEEEVRRRSDLDKNIALAL